LKTTIRQRLLLIGFGIIFTLVTGITQVKAAIPGQPIVNETPASLVKRPPVSDVSQQLIGTWEITSYETRNTTGELMTGPPWHYDRGTLIYDQKGRMAVQLVSDVRPTFSGDLVQAVNKATPEELKTAVLGYLAYFGTYTIDEKEHTVTHHVERSTNNYTGTAQLRSFEIKDNQLVLMKSATLAQGGKPRQLSSRIVWERVR